MSADWKDKLTEIKEQLPKKITFKSGRRSPTRKEVIEQKVAIYTRISDKIVRKRYKNIQI